MISDHLGSIRFVVNSASGAIAQQISYDEFGQVISNSTPGFQPFGFWLVDCMMGIRSL